LEGWWTEREERGFYREAGGGNRKGKVEEVSVWVILMFQ
jgi:hypothetical protein